MYLACVTLLFKIIAKMSLSKVFVLSHVSTAMMSQMFHPHEKLSHPEIYDSSGDRHHRCPYAYSPVNNFPSENFLVVTLCVCAAYARSISDS